MRRGIGRAVFWGLLLAFMASVLVAGWRPDGETLIRLGAAFGLLGGPLALLLWSDVGRTRRTISQIEDRLRRLEEGGAP